MQKYKVTSNLKLVSLPVDQEVKSISDNIHHLWILDRSGSMYQVLPKVIEDMKKQARTLSKGDALTFGFFSSKGKYGFPIKVFRIVDENSYKELDKLFDQHKSSLGLTCFSEILTETIQVLKDAEFLNLKTSALFFSDGYANDRSQSEEYKKVREIMSQLGKSLDMFLSVAHSNYADKDFLAEMAELSGGESVGSDSLESFTRIMDRFLRSSSTLTPRQIVKVDIPTKDIVAIFSYGDNTVNSFVPREDGLVQSAKNVWVLVKNSQDGDTESILDSPLQALYASTLVLSRKGKVSMALDILNEIGDKHFIDRLNSAFTPSERASVEDDLKEAIFDSNNRYLDGKVENYLPDPNAFCLLDLIELLSSDNKAKFYPKHPEFIYKSIGRKPIIRDGYEKFNTYLDNSCPISSFTWNKEFLNLSILATVKGTVKLKDKVEIYKEVEVDNKKNGEKKLELFGLINKPKTLGDIKESFQWKNYTLIKDGFLNINKLPISASIETIKKLEKEGLIELRPLQTISENSVFVLDLTKLPIVNKAIAEKEVSAKELLAHVLEENLLQAQIKILNSLRKELAPNEVKIQNDWTQEEREFLLASGFREDGSYSPPSDLEESTDHYDAVVFRVGIKGLSSLPSLSDVRKRLDAIAMHIIQGSTKKQPSLTLPMSLMIPTLKDFNSQVKSLSTSEQIEWIDARLNSAKLSLSKVRSQIQKPKFAMILGRQSFSDIETLESEQTINFTTDRIDYKSELTGIIQVHRKEVAI